MPKMTGYEFVEQFRMMDKNTPVLLLTAKKEWQDKKMGFAIGIDDYMTKPVNYEELQWRIRALLRRAKISNEKQIIIGDVVISEDFNMVVRGEEKITLPKKEFELLFKLLSYPNKIFTVSQILDNIWGYDSNSDETTVRTHINRLRKKFADWNEFEIVTIRGLGYRGKLNEERGKNKQENRNHSLGNRISFYCYFFFRCIVPAYDGNQVLLLRSCR